MSVKRRRKGGKGIYGAGKKILEGERRSMIRER